MPASRQGRPGDRHMGLVRRQIDDDFGVALTQKTVEIGVVGEGTEALLGRSCPIFNLVTDSDQGRLAVQAVKLRQIDTLCYLAAPHHPNIYGAHGEPSEAGKNTVGPGGRSCVLRGLASRGTSG